MSSVFISYSHDPAHPTHTEDVAGLAASLLEHGLEVFFDQNRGDEEEKVPWETWMEDKILEADHVLLVCTELYRKKVRQEVAADEGQGVCWEAGIIYLLLYRAKRNTTKFLPVVFSPADKEFILLPLQGKQYFVVDSQSGYEDLYAFLTGQHRIQFPKQGTSLQKVAQKTIKPRFAPPGKAATPARTDSILAPDKPIPAANPHLTLKPDTPPAPRHDIRGLDWYDECDAGHFLGRNDDADRIFAMLMSKPIIRLVGPSGVGKSSLIRAGLLPKIRKSDWRACVIRPFEDPSQRVPPQLTVELLTSPGTFTTPLDPAQFRAEVSPLLSSNGIERLVLFLDQFEDIVSPVAAPAAEDAMRDFLQELWEQKRAQPYLRAVVVYRTDADARLGRLWQEISGRSEGLPYFALQGLSRDVVKDIISRTAQEQGWRLETSVPDIARQLALESQKLDYSGEVFPVYLQIFLKQAEQSAEGRITAEFITSLGGVSGLIGKYLEQTLERLKARGEEWQQCGFVLESLSRSTGTKAAQSLDDLVRETGVSRDVLAKMLRELINERLVRPVGHEIYEIQHDRLAAAVIESMKDSGREAKAARDFLAAKVPAFERTMSPLVPRELVYLYRHRLRIHPTEREQLLLLASMLHNIEAGDRTKSPGAYWLGKSSPQDFLNWFIQIRHWAAEESSLRLFHAWAKDFPLCGLESQFAALAADQVPSMRAICAQWIGRTKRGDDLPLLRGLAKDRDSGVRARAVEALASFGRPEDLPVLRELAKDADEFSGVRARAVEALASFGRPEDLPVLRELARDEGSRVRLAAVKAIASFSPTAALPVLSELAKDENLSVCINAVEALASFSPAEALPLLRELVKDKKSNVHVQAVKALTGFAMEEDLPLLRKLAKDADEFSSVRVEAVKALASFSPAEALLLLRELVKENAFLSESVEAVKALASFSRAEGLPLLRKLAKKFSSERVEAVKALANFSPAEALPLLRELTKDGISSERVEAVKALANFSPAEALPLLRELVKDKYFLGHDMVVKTLRGAVKALVSLSSVEALPLLRELAKDENWIVVREATGALTSLSPAEALPLLRELAEDECLYVRSETVRALASFSREEDLPLLCKLALAPDDNGAAEAVHGLASLYSREKLEMFLNRHDQELCASALAALDEVLYMPEWMKAIDR